MKIFVTSLTFLMVATFGYFALVSAESHPPQVCGDGIVQSPNDDPNFFERCDDGGESDTCTASCQAKILGWAWSSNIGWISLSNESCNPVYVPNALESICTYDPILDYSVKVDHDPIGSVYGYAWSDNVGWICFGATCTGLINGDTPTSSVDFVANSETPEVKGWAKIVSLEDQGWISLNCVNNSSCTFPPDPDYQVVYSQASFEGINAKTLNGWGWNNNDNEEGIGWIQFNPPIGDILPWLQTKYGDIYARGDISGNPIPNTAYNATYRILSGGSVSQFSSRFEGFGGNIFVSPLFGPIDFPTPDTRYSNILGRLDVDGLIAKGALISSEAEIPDLFEGKIYYVDSNLEINNGKQFINGIDFEDGSGTVIVEGDLIINNNIIYGSAGGADRFRNLASVAWVVLGDLKINGSVIDLAGNFIVLGNLDGNNNSGQSCATTSDLIGCGQILSCYTGNCNTRLTVSGLMMAKQFVFDRTFTDLPGATEFKGSEIIIYDGRLLANTPPGLGDFAKALPIWRAGTFER